MVADDNRWSQMLPDSDRMLKRDNIMAPEVALAYGLIDEVIGLSDESEDDAGSDEG